ncbi:MAG: S1 RNA-binding domain-containing protein, partial [Aliifodinibius sp.]|nr:S1 RNA-binding domain-containing protein [Fodinibius sp.]
HVSEIANRFISDPSEALKLNDKVKVKVLEVDATRKRIALSIKQAEETPQQYKKTNKPIHKKQHQQTDDLSNLSVTDALSLLKKKFGK